MEILKIKVADLHSDPANARTHSPENLLAIRASLSRFGQQKPVVIDAKNVVRAGNGTLAAARSLGWEEIDCVRSGLDGADATAFAIADNRTAELAGWDAEALTAQWEALDEELRMVAGFNAEAIAGLAGIGDAAEKEAELPEQVEVETGAIYEVAVSCEDEGDQKRFYEKMVAEGRSCRVLTL